MGRWFSDALEIHVCRRVSDGRVCTSALSRNTRHGPAPTRDGAGFHCTLDAPTGGRAEVPPWPSQEGIGAIKKGLVEPFEYMNGARSQSLSLIGQTEHTIIRSRVPICTSAAIAW